MYKCSLVIFSAQLDYNIEMRMKRCATKHLAAEYVGALSLGQLQKQQCSWHFFAFSYFHSLQKALRRTCSGSWYQSSCLSWHIISGTMNFTSYITAILHEAKYFWTATSFDDNLLLNLRNFYRLYRYRNHLWHQLALLPGDWLAGVSARPHLE